MSHASAGQRNGYWFFIHYLTADQIETQVGLQSSANALEDVDGDRNETPKKKRLEAVLFLAKEGLSSRQLAKFAGLADATEARTLIRQLNHEYDQEGRAFRVEEIAGGYAILTRSQFANWLRRLGHIPPEKRLSQTAMETLSVVAYRQPVLRAEIEAIRGVGCSEVLKQLMDFELVKISGRSEDLGRPYLYGTTRRFLQMFGLRSIDRLPRVTWVNEVRESLASIDTAAAESETGESTVTHSVGATALLEEEEEQVLVLETQQSTRSEIDDDDDWDDDDIDDDDDEEEDDELDDVDYEDDDDDDEEWGDEDDEDSDDEDSTEEDDDELDGDSEWEEVDDDDDGWIDDDDDDEDDEDDEWD